MQPDAKKLLTGLRYINVLIAILLFNITTNGHAVIIKSGTTVGLMTQPTSAYFHGVYGGFIETSDNIRKIIFRTSYIERPKFSFGNYIDQEYGTFAQIGTKLTSKKSHGLICLLGYGKMGGYIALDKNIEHEGSRLRTYSLPGPVMNLEYEYNWKNFGISIANMMFTGLGDKEQLNAKVAWPYNLFLLNLDLHW